MVVIRLELKDPPVIGVSSSGQTIRLGGFSGLRFLGRSHLGHFRFVTHTDRGPNTDEEDRPKGTTRPFGVPNFQPRLVYLEGDPKQKTLMVTRQLPLMQKHGSPISGLPPGADNEIAVDFKGRNLGADENGLDLEGVTFATDGSFWMAEEYGPSLVHFSLGGRMIDRFMPGKELPETFRYRRLNRGFEGVSLSGNKLFGLLESPLDNPPSPKQANSVKSRITRMVEVDIARRITTGQYAYVMEEANTGRLSDMTMADEHNFLVLERGRTDGKDWRRIYRAGIFGATNLQRLSSQITGPGGTLESLAPAELAKNGIVPMKKELLFDLGGLGLKEEKPEGIDKVGDEWIAVIIDNDFELSGGLDHENAVGVTKDEPAAIYLIKLEQSQ
ncbi:MAG TPA: esterase-like activity of phytase family protein [Bdellovibrionota bacterium]|jgi:3-phytase